MFLYIPKFFIFYVKFQEHNRHTIKLTCTFDFGLRNSLMFPCGDFCLSFLFEISLIIPSLWLNV